MRQELKELALVVVFMAPVFYAAVTYLPVLFI